MCDESVTDGNRSLSILHITNPGSVGGLESVVRSVTAGLQRAGHRVGVIAVLDAESSGHPFLEALRRHGVGTISINLPARAYVREIREVAAEIKRFSPDVIHTHGARADVLHSWGARNSGIPIVTTLHGSSRPGGLAGWSERLQALMIRRFDAVVAVSRPLLEDLVDQGVPSDRIHLIPNGPGVVPELLSREAARRELELDATGDPVIGWVGRLIPVKGADIFLRALGRLLHLKWTGSVVGDGPELQMLRELARDLKIADRVRFHGSIPDAARYQSAFDLFVLSSRSEGIPMVLFEAASSGVPVVASAVGGVPDVVSSQEARLVPPEDPEGLAGAIEDALLDREGSLRRASRARGRLATESGQQMWIARYEALYRDLAMRSR